MRFLRPRMSVADWQVLIGAALAVAAISLAAMTWHERIEASEEPNVQVIVLTKIDCSAFPSREAAHTFNKLLGADVFGLDNDRDGVPCEGLASR